MKLAALWKDEVGQGLTEYGLIMALVAVAAVVVLTTLGGQIRAKLQGAADALGSAAPSP